jgi:hypothetical protein
MAARQDKQAPVVGGLVEVTIVRGTYVTADGSFGPGKSVRVPAADAEQLKRLGIVRPDDYVAPAEVQDGTLQVTTTEGPSVSSVA